MIGLLGLATLLLLIAFALTIGAALGRAPLWVAVLLVALAQLLTLSGVR
jgi:hypothetical protein